MIESVIENIGGVNFLGIGMTPDSAFELLQGKAVRVRFKGLCITLWRAKTQEQLQKDLQVYENGVRLPLVWVDPPQDDRPEESRVESTRDQTRKVTDVLKPEDFFLRVLEKLSIRDTPFGIFDTRTSPSEIRLRDARGYNTHGHIERWELEAAICEVLAK